MLGAHLLDIPRDDRRKLRLAQPDAAASGTLVDVDAVK
jgi:hypothetical protein